MQFTTTMQQLTPLGFPFFLIPGAETHVIYNTYATIGMSGVLARDAETL